SAETTTASTTTTPPATTANTTAPQPTGPQIPVPTIKIGFYRAVLLVFAMAFVALAAYHVLKERRAKASAMGAGGGFGNPP
ncbi:MAG: hypothetical protein QXL35_04305, partial [Candidatus Bathyarchaeia archaeon]